MTANASPSTGSAGTMRAPVDVVMPPSDALAAEEVDADEAGDVAGARSGGDIGERARLDDGAVVEDDDAVGQRVGVDGIVGDDEADAIERGEVSAQVATDVAAGAGVEGGEGFVEEQQPGLGGEGTGQRDALRLAAGQGAWAVVGVVGEVDTLEPRHGPGSGIGLAHVAGAQPEGDVLQGGEVGEQQVVLEDDGDGPAFGAHEDVGRRIVEGLAVELDAPVVDGQQPGEAAEQGALAGPVRSEHGDGLAALRGQLDVEEERPDGPPDPGVEAHGVGGRPPPRKRSRKATSTPKDTAISTRLSTIASSGSISLVR